MPIILKLDEAIEQKDCRECNEQNLRNEYDEEPISK
jgi:hypothetical protein